MAVARPIGKLRRFSKLTVLFKPTIETCHDVVFRRFVDKKAKKSMHLELFKLFRKDLGANPLISDAVIPFIPQWFPPEAIHQDMNSVQQDFDRVMNLKLLEHWAVVQRRHMGPQRHGEHRIDEFSGIDP